MGDESLSVEIRTETGKGAARRLRAVGRAPAVLYGHGKAPVSLTVNSKELDVLLRSSHAGMNTLIDLDGASEVKGRVVLVKDIQRHPVARTLVHVDFFEIDTSEKIHVSVPIRLIGSPVGVKLGGILEHTMREIDLACLPTAIPDSLDIDIADLDIGESLHVSDLTFPDGVESTLDTALPVVHIVAKKAEEVVEVTAETAAEGEGADAAKSEDGEADKDS
ncbi:MAG: large subunit ribosomal protein L25 [Myxococcota bacterium]